VVLELPAITRLKDFLCSLLEGVASSAYSKLISIITFNYDLCIDFTLYQAGQIAWFFELGLLFSLSKTRFLAATPILQKQALACFRRYAYSSGDVRTF